MDTERILETTAEYYGVSVADIKGYSRRRHVTKARQEAAWRLRMETDLSLHEIADLLHKTHGSITYAVRKLKEYTACQT